MHKKIACGSCYTQHKLSIVLSTRQQMGTCVHGAGNIISVYSLYKQQAMRSLLYIIAVILVIGWILGFFVWSAPGLIHILLVLAVIAFLLGIIRRA